MNFSKFYLVLFLSFSSGVINTQQQDEKAVAFNLRCI
jgi:hypothetical protein